MADLLCPIKAGLLHSIKLWPWWVPHLNALPISSLCTTGPNPIFTVHSAEQWLPGSIKLSIQTLHYDDTISLANVKPQSQFITQHRICPSIVLNCRETESFSPSPSSGSRVGVNTVEQYPRHPWIRPSILSIRLPLRQKCLPPVSSRNPPKTNDGVITYSLVKDRSPIRLLLLLN